MARVLQECLPAPAPVASVLVTPGSIEGRIWPRESKEPVPVDEILVLGDHIRLYERNTTKLAPDARSTYDRQIKALGKMDRRGSLRRRSLWWERVGRVPR